MSVTYVLLIHHSVKYLEGFGNRAGMYLFNHSEKMCRHNGTIQSVILLSIHLCMVHYILKGNIFLGNAYIYVYF